MDLKQKSVALLAIELVAASFIVLFQELSLIRWIASQIRAMAYFPNLILLSTFLGLGIGCLRSGKKPLLLLWPIFLLILTINVSVMGRIIFTHNSASEHLWLLYYDLPKDTMVVPRIDIPIIMTFILSSLSFIPLGQIVAERIQEFRHRSNPLMGYIYDIFGSLCGVIIFSLINLFNIFPVYWFALFLAAGFLFFSSNKKHILIYAIFIVAILFTVAKNERSDAYSPYYALSRKTIVDSKNFTVLTNGSLHQNAMDLAKATYRRDIEYDSQVFAGYHYPYSLLKSKPQKALVLGAGTGNDVAVLLDEGVGHVDVVEIDPTIIKWGRQFHPNRPYDSDKVTIHNTDARSFLNISKDKYDLIIFGTLDSMTRLSALSNVRLDNFVYTMESIEAAQKCLAPQGGILMYFMVSEPYIDQRLSGILLEAFGELPLVHRDYHHLFNRIYMAGPAFYESYDIENLKKTRKFRDETAMNIQIPKDDWPYLYLKGREITKFYLTIMLAIVGVSFAGIFLASPAIRIGLFSRKNFDAEMFLFGMAFLLLETGSVTKMSLLWGSTWLTSAIVFGSILLMILLATLREKWRTVPFQLSAFGLIISLLVTYILPLRPMLGQHLVIKLIFSIFAIGTPIYFASSCFAHLFAQRKNTDQAFGWNLVGAVCGGLLEFLSMVIGLKSLLLVALLSYTASFLIRLKNERALN